MFRITSFFSHTEKKEATWPSAEEFKKAMDADKEEIRTYLSLNFTSVNSTYLLANYVTAYTKCAYNNVEYFYFQEER
jgi:hypothetical protein